MLLFYYISVLTLVISIVLGFKNYKRLKNLKFIFYILIFSLIQIFFSEILLLLLDRITPNFLDKWISKAFTITNVYTIIEFCLILGFLYSINQNIKTRKALSILFFLGILAYVSPFFTREYENFIMLKYFSFISGLIILPTSLFQINFLLKAYNTKNKVDNANLIMCIGIFLSNIILWPTIIIQSLVEFDFKRFYELFVIANSIGYTIMYLFSLIIFYGKNKF